MMLPHSEHSFPRAKHVPGKPGPGAEVVVIRIMNGLNLNPFLSQSQLRIEAAQNVIPVMRNSHQIVTHAEVECESRIESPIILKEQRVGHPANVGLGITVE